MDMHRRILLPLVAAITLIAPAQAYARGGNYVFDGGTAPERAQVKASLNASSFNWSLVPTRVTIHIGRVGNSDATPGEIWLDAGLLDSGIFSWGVVQHEYGHQVDFFLLNESKRTAFERQLGGVSWWQTGGLAHAQLSSERFASTLAWAYWPSKQNLLRPQSKTDEAGAMAPAAFRRLLAQQLGVAQLAAAPR